VEAARRDEQTLTAGSLEVRLSDGFVQADGRPLPLSLRELRLLVALIERRDRIVSRQELYRLLEEAVPGLRFIHTHFGFGYRMSVEPSHSFHNAETSPQQAHGTRQGETTT
jgi:DNA-binding winged helix-turn-helix (wHTH) protein